MGNAWDSFPVTVLYDNVGNISSTDGFPSTILKQEVIDWCRANIADLSLGSLKWSSEQVGRVTFYFKNPKEAMLFKLTWGGS